MNKFLLIIALFGGGVVFYSLEAFAVNDSPPVAAKKLKVVPSLPKKEEVPQHLQDISVTIRANHGLGASEGSGVITNINGVNYVLTCGHVVSHLRSTREVIDSSGAKKTVVEFNDAEIVKELVEDGRTVGQLRFFAEVVRYSDADNGEDLALLRVRKKNLDQHYVHFYMEDKIPTVGTELYHVGSLLGQSGSNSMTSGITSQIGRLVNNQTYDQTTCAAFPGSSGGGVYLKDGRYVAMIVRGAGETFNLVVPMRRIKTWSKKVGMEFVINPDSEIPDDAAIRKCPIEDSPVRGRDKAAMKPIANKFLIIDKIRTPAIMPVHAPVMPFLIDD